VRNVLAHTRLIAISASLLVALGAYPASAAAESCAYDSSTRAVTASITTGSQATLRVGPSGELLFGLSPVACGAATSTNTDSIAIAGAAATVERLTIDLQPGPIGPGFTSEFNLPEIEMALSLGGTNDRLVVIGSEGNDTLTAGASGVSLNSDGDLDVTFTTLPSNMEFQARGGTNFLTGRGGFGAGLAFPGGLTMIAGNLGDELNGANGNDVITGGAGNDVITGNAGDDQISGGGGNDRMSGSDGNDSIVGGAGSDELIGGNNNDFLDANDGVADVQIHGGAGTDTAHYDAGIDPALVAVENPVADPGDPPPPPPTGPCTYNASSRAVTATLAANTQATLKVGPAGQLILGAVACGTATTANTDSIDVVGTAGGLERITFDLTGGVFGPGFTAEGNVPEIEIAVALGSAADQVVVIGTNGNDTIAAGLNGLSLNADGDVDVTFSVQPAALEIQGLDGVNFLTGRGGFGAGLAYAGSLTLRAGNLGDELNGGNGNDTLVGGNGNDVITGNAGADQVTGGAGNDMLSGSDGNDSIVGGPGADSLVGGFDDDTLDAFDGEADTQIHGGPGVDTAYVDPGLDPATIAVENVIGAATPPPAPPAPPAPAANTCVYHADQKAVAATVSPNGTATLAVVSGQIRFGASHVPCGAATNANTDTIFVFGSAGAKKRLVVNLTGGPFTPGATVESTGSSEIEIVTNLGSPTDEILVLGSVADETLVAGAAGMAFNSDGDADLIYASPPAYVELQGGGGRNVLTAQGGLGTGGAFAGKTTIMAGMLGDELHGGNGDDLLVGGAGNDAISGYAGVDQLWGLGGNDTLNGGDGNDALIGGAGIDSLSGGSGDDLLDAVDTVADTLIDGGAGNDTAYYDRVADPAPVAVEIHFPR